MGVTAEGDRVAGFGRLEDGLRQARPWYMWGPSVRDHPYVLRLDGRTATIDYEPAESTTSLFGGNLNWRGPVWFPLNFLVISCLEKYYSFFGDDLTVEYPAGSGDLIDPLE
jgi:hypothetical protein